MKNYFKDISLTWSWRHKEYIIIASLFLALIIQTWDMGMPEAEAVAYVADCTGLDCEIETITAEIFERDRDVNMERARLEALRTLNAELLQRSYESQYVDYEHIKQTIYGDQASTTKY